MKHIENMSRLSLERALFYFIDSVKPNEPEYSKVRTYAYERMAVGA